MTKLTREQVLQTIESARARGDKPDFVGVDLKEMELLRVDLHAVNLSGANLRGTRYDKATTWPVNFNPTRLGAIRED